MSEIRMRIVARYDGREFTSEVVAEPDTHVAVVVLQVIREHGLPTTEPGWQLVLGDTAVRLTTTVGDLATNIARVGPDEVITGLILTRREADAESSIRVAGTRSMPDPSERTAYLSRGLPAESPMEMRTRSSNPDNISSKSSTSPWKSTGPSHPSGSIAMHMPPARGIPPLAGDPEYDEDDYEDDEDSRQSGRMVSRQATVRYYSRMNPERMYPMIVVLSAEEIEQVMKSAVQQAQSAGFQVEAGSSLVVEPLLPGCDCYPPTETITADPQPVTVTFWVVPRVLGKVSGARVVLRQNGRVLSEVPLDVRVSKQTAAVMLGLLGLFAPYLTIGLKAARLDLESQQEDGFPLYRMAGTWCADNVRAEWVGFGLLGLAVLFYLWARPRRRDVFWDVTPKPAPNY